MDKKIKVAVIYGGKSGEHEVSINSAKNVMGAMSPEKYEIVEIFITKEGRWERNGEAFDPWTLPEVCDLALPILHGPNGEDGTVQGLLKLLGMPFGGTGLLGCAASMDKIMAKDIFKAYGLAQTPYISFTSPQISESLVERIKSELKFPIFIKPANMGSSVGITRVSKPEDLMDAIKLAAHYDSRLVAEQGVNCREVEIAVMGNEELSLGEIGEILPAEEFYSYDAKYNDAESKLLIPAPITAAQAEKIRSMAMTAYKALGCDGFARCDFMIDKDSGDILINEINAIPGFTKISMFPMLMQAAGMSYPQIIDRIIELGYERYNAENNR